MSDLPPSVSRPDSESNPPITLTQLADWKRMTRAELEALKLTCNDWDVSIILNELCWIKIREAEIEAHWSKIGAVMDKRSNLVPAALTPQPPAPIAWDAPAPADGGAWLDKPFTKATPPAPARPKLTAAQRKAKPVKLSPKQRYTLEYLRDAADMPADEFLQKHTGMATEVQRYALPQGWLTYGWYGDGLHKPTVQALLSRGLVEQQTHEYEIGYLKPPARGKVTAFRITDLGKRTLAETER